MKKIIALILTILTVFSVGALSSCNKSEEKTLAVAIKPLETFLNEIVKDKFNIVVAVPNGQSPESYEPTPKEMLALSNAKTYFSIGIPNEVATILPNVNCDKVLLHDEVANKGLAHLTFENGARDPHIWLSVKRAIKIVEIMRDKVVSLDSENAEFYVKNANEYVTKLNALHDELTTKFNAIENSKKTFIAYHPSFNYFANEYGLTAYALEKNGHEATAKDLAEMVIFAKNNGIKNVFYQAETDSSQAISFANEIGGTAIKLSPLSANYIENLKEMANAII